MIKAVAFLLLSTLIFQLGAQAANSCSSFCISSGGQPFFGRNFDYDVKGGMIFVNKRNVAKSAASFENPAQWTSKYGSVTFNLYGCELPMGGMNEAGLVTAVLWLDGSEYTPPDSLPTISDLQWVQYQLDNCATIEDVIATRPLVRVTNYSGSQIHYLLSDGGGNCAVVEFLAGEMVIYSGDGLPAPVLTNSTYKSSLDLWRRFDGDTTSEGYTASANSRGRFIKILNAINRFGDGKKENAINYAFDLLEDVGFELTQWRIVYDIKAKKIHFTTMDNRSVRIIDMNKLDFSCSRPVLLYDLASIGSGDVSDHFEEYTYQKNHALILKSFRETGFLQETPESVLELLARYPESLTCRE